MPTVLLLLTFLGPDYDALVERYRREDAAAVGQLADEPREAVKEAFEVFRQRATRRSSPDPAALLAAALLHTEVALVAEPEQDKERDFHLGLARASIDDARRLSPPPAHGTPSFECQWSLAVAYYFIDEGQLRRGLQASRDAEPACAGRPEFWLSRAALHELLSGLGGEAAFVRELEIAPEWAVADPAGDDRQRELARFCLQRAIGLDPALPEARLRLGRVLALSGRVAEAVEQLSWVLDNDHDREHLYLAHLFLGEVRDHQGRPAEAALRYRAAQSLVSHSQSATLALSYSRLMAGDGSGARESLLTSFKRQQAPEAFDPWLLYSVGTPIRGYENAMKELHAAIRTPATP